MRTGLVVVGTTALALGATLVAATPAAALPPPIVTPSTPDQVWVQSFERASQDAPCIPPAELDIAWQPDWNPAEKDWHAIWEQWPHGNTGGWTCFRIITWAKGAPAVYAVIR